MVLLTNDAEELEESLTDETATAKEPRPEADELSSLCPGLLQPRYDETATAEVLHSDVADELTTDEPQINGHVYIVPVRFEEYIVGILFTLISAFLRRLHLPEHQADELTTAEDLLTDESRTAVELFTDETATADELLSDEADELTTDASQITVLPSSLTKPNTGRCSD